MTPHSTAKSPLSLASLRIRSNCSTLDLTFKPVPLFSPWQTRKGYESGRGWGHFRVQKPRKLGPFQSAIPSRWCWQSG
jgi:hypothetical protein